MSHVLLEVDGLDLYYGDAQALSGVSLKLAASEIVAIVGANGAGKSSLIRRHSRHRKARAGTVRFDGIDITGLPSHRVCEAGIGHVAEGRQVFPKSQRAGKSRDGRGAKAGPCREKATLDRVFALFPRLIERRKQAAGPVGRRTADARHRPLPDGPATPHHV